MPKRRIKNAEITLISLCRRGKNKQPVVYKGDNVFELTPLVKQGNDFDELGELLVVVYPPNYRDSDGDIADSKAIKSMAHSFAKKGKGLDIEHDGNTLSKDRAYLAESFLIAKGDERFQGWKDVDGNPVDVVGGWGGVIKLEDPALRKLYKSGEWDGVSMFGRAEVEVDKANDDEGMIDRIIRRLGLKARVPTGDIEMDKSELESMFKSLGDKLVEAVKTAVTPPKPPEPVVKAEPVKKPACPVYKGSYTDKAALLKHADAVRVWKALNDLDLEDPEAIAEFAKSMEDTQVKPPKSNQEDDKSAPTEGNILAMFKSASDGSFSADDIKASAKAAEAMNAYLKKAQGQA